MLQSTKDEKIKILWQEWDEDTPSEPAIAITQYSDCIELAQMDNTINLNYHHVAELIKHLKSCKP